jgi:protein ImuB
VVHPDAALRAEPVAVIDPRTARGPRVVLCSRKAADVGVRAGMPVVEALAIVPQLRLLTDDPEADRRALEDLAAWATRFGPVVGLEDGPRPQGLLLDVTGCGAYFGGEEKLLDRAAHQLEAAGWVARLALADTVGAAWGLSRYGRTPCLVHPGATAPALSPLPVAALRLPLAAQQLLRQLGIERVRQLSALPRDSLPARFGPLVLRRLDQALGRLPEPIVPHKPPPVLQERFDFEYATERLDVLLLVLDQLVQRLQEALARRQQGARQVEWVLHHEAAPPTPIAVSLSRPSRSPAHLSLLLRTRLEEARLRGPVAAVSLRVVAAEYLVDPQADFLDAERPDGEGLARLIDQLSNYLGREAVTRAHLVPDPQPEYACRFEPLVQGTRKSPSRGSGPPAPEGCILPPRPLRLWPAPEPIQVLSVAPEGPPVRIDWRSTVYGVVGAWGPERIETGWWRGEDVRRDYYVTATERGSRFWIFRRMEDGHWFLHGTFD